MSICGSHNSVKSRWLGIWEHEGEDSVHKDCVIRAQHGGTHYDISNYIITEGHGGTHYDIST